MADIVGFSVVRAGNVALTVPTWTISGKVVKADDHSVVLNDFSGANVVSFPQVLGQLTAAQQDEVLGSVVMLLLAKKFGL